jgi:hypothetical protein
LGIQAVVLLARQDVKTLNTSYSPVIEPKKYGNGWVFGI